VFTLFRGHPGVHAWFHEHLLPDLVQRFRDWCGN
jgi:hypothetical protein